MNAKKKALKETAANQMPEKEQEVIYIDDLFNKKQTTLTLPFRILRQKRRIPTK